MPLFSELENKLQEFIEGGKRLEEKMDKLIELIEYQNELLAHIYEKLNSIEKLVGDKGDEGK